MSCSIKERERRKGHRGKRGRSEGRWGKGEGEEGTLEDKEIKRERGRSKRKRGSMHRTGDVRLPHTIRHSQNCEIPQVTFWIALSLMLIDVYMHMYITYV